MSQEFDYLLNGDDEDILAKVQEESLRYYKEVELPRLQKDEEFTTLDDIIAIDDDSNEEPPKPNPKPNQNVTISGSQIDSQTQGGSKELLYSGEEANGFHLAAGSNYIYPTNYPVRQYQSNIVRTALFKNTLVTLPTGLGKTFIAAVVMYNFYRWYPCSKVVFMAPTRPLVAQQIKACHNIMNIPVSHTTEMTGALNVEQRKILWQEKRVFFLTPQVMVNDLKSKLCPAESLKCLVVDEAHRATKDYAYCQVIKLLQLEKGCEYRVLALSATPGNDVNAVQQVIKNLQITALEIRGEDALDVAPYTHSRSIENIVVSPSFEMQRVKDDFLQIYEKYARRLKDQKTLPNNISTISKFQVLKALEKFRANPPRGLPASMIGSLVCDFMVCMSLSHALELLQTYGLRAFYTYLTDETNEKCKAAISRLNNDDDLKKLLGKLKQILYPDPTSNYPYTWGHPKLQKLVSALTEHFKKAEDANQPTKAIVFCQYRVVVSEIVELLNQSKPQIKPAIFIGQSSGGGGKDKGMPQSKQLQIMKEFREGKVNCLVATCVAEEGLDIGEVDLIILMEAHKSPVRLVQRIGRTGRKRKGRCIILLAKGKEEQKFHEAMASRKAYVNNITNSPVVQSSLCQYSPSMFPPNIKPVQQLVHINVTKLDSPSAKPSTSKKQVDIRNCMVTQESPYLTEDEFKKVMSELGTSNFSSDRFQNGCEIWHRRYDKKMEPNELLTQNFNKLYYWNEWNTEVQTAFTVSNTSLSKDLVDLLKLAENPGNLQPIDENEIKAMLEFEKTEEEAGPSKESKSKRNNVIPNEVEPKEKKSKKPKKEIPKKAQGMDIRSCMAAAAEKAKVQQKIEIIDLDEGSSEPLEIQNPPPVTRISTMDNLEAISKIFDLKSSELENILYGDSLLCPFDKRETMCERLDKYLVPKPKPYLEPPKSNLAIDINSLFEGNLIANLNMKTLFTKDLNPEKMFQGDEDDFFNDTLHEFPIEEINYLENPTEKVIQDKDDFTNATHHEFPIEEMNDVENPTEKIFQDEDDFSNATRHEFPVDEMNDVENPTLQENDNSNFNKPLMDVSHNDDKIKMLDDSLCLDDILDINSPNENRNENQPNLKIEPSNDVTQSKTTVEENDDDEISFCLDDILSEEDSTEKVEKNQMNSKIDSSNIVNHHNVKNTTENESSFCVNDIVELDDLFDRDSEDKEVKTTNLNVASSSTVPETNSKKRSAVSQPETFDDLIAPKNRERKKSTDSDDIVEIDDLFDEQPKLQSKTSMFNKRKMFSFSEELQSSPSNSFIKIKKRKLSVESIIQEINDDIQDDNLIHKHEPPKSQFGREIEDLLKTKVETQNFDSENSIPNKTIDPLNSQTLRNSLFDNTNKIFSSTPKPPDKPKGKTFKKSNIKPSQSLTIKETKEDSTQLSTIKEEEWKLEELFEDDDVFSQIELPPTDKQLDQTTMIGITQMVSMIAKDKRKETEHTNTQQEEPESAMTQLLSDNKFKTPENVTNISLIKEIKNNSITSINKLDKKVEEDATQNLNKPTKYINSRENENDSEDEIFISKRKESANKPHLNYKQFKTKPASNIPQANKITTNRLLTTPDNVDVSPIMFESDVRKTASTSSPIVQDKSKINFTTKEYSANESHARVNLTKIFSDLVNSPPSPVKKEKKQKKSKKPKRKDAEHVFIEKEAEESGFLTSDDSDNSSLDELDESFIDDETQGDMTHVHYLKSVKSPPVRGKFKIPTYQNNVVDVYSQQVEQDTDYMHDSFCVESDEEDGTAELTALEIAERKLAKEKRKRSGKVKNKNFDPTISISDEDEDPMKSPAANFVSKKRRIIHSDSESDVTPLKNNLMKNTKRLRYLDSSGGSGKDESPIAKPSTSFIPEKPQNNKRLRYLDSSGESGKDESPIAKSSTSFISENPKNNEVIDLNLEENSDEEFQKVLMLSQVEQTIDPDRKFEEDLQEAIRLSQMEVSRPKFQNLASNSSTKFGKNQATINSNGKLTLNSQKTNKPSLKINSKTKNFKKQKVESSLKQLDKLNDIFSKKISEINKSLSQ